MNCAGGFAYAYLFVELSRPSGFDHPVAPE